MRLVSTGEINSTASYGPGQFSNITHSMIFRLEFEDFLQLQALQMTEIYEYAMSLSTTTSLPSFQSLKFIYATCLLDHGLTQQAFAYFERIATEVIKGNCYF